MRLRLKPISPYVSPITRQADHQSSPGSPAGRLNPPTYTGASLYGSCTVVPHATYVVRTRIRTYLGPYHNRLCITVEDRTIDLIILVLTRSVPGLRQHSVTTSYWYMYGGLRTCL